MFRNSSPGAVEVRLPEALENRLRFYSIAAAAAGVGVLALAHPAEAEVVITHKVIPVPLNGTTVSIDINHDGIPDFQFSFVGKSSASYLRVKPLAGGAVVLGPPNSYEAAALKRDVMIGPHAHFSSKEEAILEVCVLESQYVGSSLGSVFWVCNGDWDDTANRYLGVKFPIDGETHYGWVRMTVFTSSAGFSASVDSYAYETDANTPICAREVQPCPAPPGDSAETGKNVSGGPSLGMLALGADGLTLWRREALAY